MDQLLTPQEIEIIKVLCKANLIGGLSDEATVRMVNEVAATAMARKNG